MFNCTKRVYLISEVTEELQKVLYVKKFIDRQYSRRLEILIRCHTAISINEENSQYGRSSTALQ